MICFECQHPITDSEKYFTTHAPKQDTFLHWSCVRKIVNDHITDVIAREADIDSRAAQKDRRNAFNESVALANKLGFRKAGE